MLRALCDQFGIVGYSDDAVAAHCRLMGLLNVDTQMQRQLYSSQTIATQCIDYHLQ